MDGVPMDGGAGKWGIAEGEADFTTQRLEDRRDEFWILRLWEFAEGETDFTTQRLEDRRDELDF